jgi:hypothetical protein
MDKTVNTTSKTTDIVLDPGNEGDKEESMQNIGLYICMYVSSLKFEVKLLYKC